MKGLGGSGFHCDLWNLKALCFSGTPLSTPTPPWRAWFTRLLFLAYHPLKRTAYGHWKPRNRASGYKAGHQRETAAMSAINGVVIRYRLTKRRLVRGCNDEIKAIFTGRGSSRWILRSILIYVLLKFMNMNTVECQISPSLAQPTLYRPELFCRSIWVWLSQ
jgi:hypothetical protein